MEDPNKKKILFAFGTKFAGLENALEKTDYWKQHYQSCEVNIMYRESLVDMINRLRPQKVLVLSELPSQFKGQPNKEKSLTSLFYDLMVNPNIDNGDIVLIANDMKPGNEILDTIYSYGFYNILTGNFNISKLWAMLNKPQAASDASEYKVIKNVSDNESRTLYSAPTGAKEKIIYVDNDKPVSNDEQENNESVLLKGQTGLEELKQNEIQQGHDIEAAKVAKEIDFGSDSNKDDFQRFKEGTVNGHVYRKASVANAVEYKENGWHFSVTKARD